MKKRLLYIALVLLFHQAEAQGVPTFDVPLPSTQQILRMRYHGLCQWAEKHKPAMNELECDELAAYYTELRERSDRGLVANKPALKTAMDALREWNSAYYRILFISNGGGTVYSHAGNRSYADMAEVEADSAAAWTRPAKSTTKGQAKPFSAGHSMFADAPPSDKANYAKVSAEEASLLKKAQAAIALLPVGPRALLTDYLVTTANQKWGEQSRE